MADTRWNNYTTGGNQTWTAPEGISSITVEAWGGGGGGGSNNRTTAANAGGGGGGGAYATRAVTVVGGTSYSLHVGNGGPGGSNNNNGTVGNASNFNNGTPDIVKAGGGAAGNRNGANGAGGTTANSNGSTTWAGGRGNNKNANNGGGGGGAGASRNVAGNNAASITGATGQNGGGNGGNGGALQASGSAGLTYGGGGGGAGTNGQTRTGGTGGNGAVLISWAGDFTKTLTEATTLADSVTVPSKTLTEVLGLSHATMKLAGIILLEALTLTDPTITTEKTSGGNNYTVTPSPTETITLSDTIHPVKGAQQIANSLGLTDVIEKQGAYGRTLVENATLTDTRLRGTTRAIAETLTLTDRRMPAIILTESAGLSDSITKGGGKVIANSLSVTDVLAAKPSSKFVSELVTLGGTVRKDVGRTLVETAGLSDARTMGGGKQTAEVLSLTTPTLRVTDIAIRESLSVADVAAKGEGKSLVESVALTDPAVETQKTSGSTAYTKDLTETAGLADSLQKSMARLATQSLGLSDTSQKSQGRTLSEALTATDVLTKQGTYARVPVEVVHVGDAPVTTEKTSAGNYTKTLTETAVLTDTLTRQVTYARTLSEGTTLWGHRPEGAGEAAHGDPGPLRQRPQGRGTFDRGRADTHRHPDEGGQSGPDRGGHPHGSCRHHPEDGRGPELHQGPN